MNQVSKNLPSEQIPNDGGWHWDRLVKEANDRLSKIGKHGKRAKIKVTPKPGKPISVQFSLSGQGQKSYGLDLPLSRNNLVKAEEYCQLITTQLVTGTFTEDWFYKLLGKTKKVSEEKKPLTCGEMLKQYKAHFFKQRTNHKTPKQFWKTCYSHAEKTFSKYHDEPINLKIVREIIECTENNTFGRKCHLNGLANLLKHFDNNEFKQVIKKYKSENKPKPKSKHIPDDGEIIDVYNFGFKINPNCANDRRYRYAQWQFLYALLATYGLRVHEAWNIKNWNEPVTIKGGDWVAIPTDEYNTENENDQGQFEYRQWRDREKTIPAILDPENQDYLLCIGHKTKTGYRVAFPISPSGHSRNCTWIKEFNITQPLNLPDIPDPLGYKGKGNDGSLVCSNTTGLWFRNHKYGFTAHALRHAYNIRGHNLGINQKILANSLGHSILMNSTTYMKYEKITSKIQGLKNAIHEDTYKRSELERLQDENKHLKVEIEKLRAELTMYKALSKESHS